MRKFRLSLVNQGHSLEKRISYTSRVNSVFYRAYVKIWNLCFCEDGLCQPPTRSAFFRFI